MSMLELLSPGAVKAGAAAGVVASLQTASQSVIVIDRWLYSVLAVAISLIGVWLARLVTIEEENKRLGRVQRLSETGPLTWIGVLLVAPAVWHWQLPVPGAAVLGLGVGYTVRIVLKIIGSATTAAARALAQQAAEAMGVKESLAATPPPREEDPEAQALLDQLNDVPPRLPPPQ